MLATKLKLGIVVSISAWLVIASGLVWPNGTQMNQKVDKVDTGDRWLEADIDTLQAATSAGDLSAEALTQYYLSRIERYNQNGAALNAVQRVNERALDEARALDRERIKSGPRSALHGIPVLVKDNYETKGLATSVGSTLFASHQPQRNAALVERLQAAGAVILGKTTMHEFAYGITNQGSLYGAGKNPYDLSRNPGGSSGGSAAAVAANFSTFAMGSDTCGSIRIPAAQNNLVGLRGTQGLSSRHGIVPLSSTQDIGGPLTRSVKDLAYVLDSTVGFDERDSQTADSLGHIPSSYVAALGLKTGARIGVLSGAMRQTLADEPVAEVVTGALRTLEEQADWAWVELASPELDEALTRPLNGHYVLIYDFAQDMNTYLRDNPTLGFGSVQDLATDPRVHASVVDSLQASAAMDEKSHQVYLQEVNQRVKVRQTLLSLMAQHELDALVYPTIRQVAAHIGEEQQGTNCRLSANSGLPAITVPAGFSDGVPVGLELLGHSWGEQALLNLAFTIEKFHPQRKAPGATP